MSRFDQEALTWDNKPEVVQSSQAFYDTLVSRIDRLNENSAQLNILDLGCGTGLVSQRLAQCKGVATIIGVDTSKGMIDVFNSKSESLPQGRKMKGIVKLLEDPDDPVLEGRKFDYALMHLTLHHVPDMEALIKTVAGTLKANGQVILSDFEDNGEHAKSFHPRSKWHDVERHGIKRQEMEQVFKAAGLQNVAVENSFSLPKTIESGEESQFPFLLGIGGR